VTALVREWFRTESTEHRSRGGSAAVARRTKADETADAAIPAANVLREIAIMLLSFSRFVFDERWPDEVALAQDCDFFLRQLEKIFVDFGVVFARHRLRRLE
jgi:hypothetical protein